MAVSVVMSPCMPCQLDLLFASADAAQQAEVLTVHLQLTAAALSLYTPQTTSGKGDHKYQVTNMCIHKVIASHHSKHSLHMSRHFFANW